MKLYTLNEFNNISGNMEEYKARLIAQNPHLTEDEINNTLHAVFFGNSGDNTELTTVTEGLEEILNEAGDNIAMVAMKAMKIKGKQKKANKLKLDIVTVDQKADDKRDKIADGKTKAEGGMDREQKKEVKTKIDDQAKKKKDILSKKETELQKIADEKAGSNNFLNAYKMMLRNKGNMKKLDAELADAEGKEAEGLKRKIKEVKGREAEAKKDLEAAKKAEQEETAEPAETKTKVKEKVPSTDDAEPAETKETPEEKKKAGVNKQVEKHQATVDKLAKEIKKLGGQPKKDAQYKLDQAKDNLTKAKAKADELGESVDLEDSLTIVEAQLNAIVEEYGFILE